MLPLPAYISTQAITPQESLRVRIDLAEPEAVLAILESRSQGRNPSGADWSRLFATEGYRRLKRREAAMNRAFEDAEFQAYVMSEALLNRMPELKQALDGWRRADPLPAAKRALAYLPAGARIQATIFAILKPRTNSFVFEAETDPAIFIYMDPTRSQAMEENTLAHELHHIGLSSLPHREDPGLQKTVRLARTWTGAFGEGFAMLAAAGGPGIHPHATSPASDRERWDRDVARFPEEFARVLAFFRRVLDGSLGGEAATKEAMAFFGIQGPWYTVGWRMAALIETRLGKDRLLSVVGDLPTLYRAWNEAATAEEAAGGAKLPRWPQDLVDALEAGATSRPNAKSAATGPRFE